MRVSAVSRAAVLSTWMAVLVWAPPAPGAEPGTDEESAVAVLERRLAARTRAFRNLLDHLRRAREAHGELEKKYASLREELTRLDGEREARAEAQEKLAASWAANEELRREISRAKAAEQGLSEEESAQVAELLAKGRKAEQDGDLEAAIWLYKEAEHLCSGHFQALLLLGHALTARGLDVEAERVLMEAFRKAPNDVRVLVPLGQALLRQEKPEMALSMFARAIALEPKNPKFLNYMGLTCRSLGWSVGAERVLRRAHRLDPENPEAAFNLAVLLATLDRPRVAEAKEWYERAKQNGAKPDRALEAFFYPERNAVSPAASRE